MLDKRRFHYPARRKGKDEKVPDTVEGRAAPAFRKWQPIEGEYAVVMERSDPMVGR
jgi:alpha-N-arabinofuranosidase